MKGPSTVRLIAVPALIGIAVTALRLVGELLRWPKPMVSSDVCGKAILGLSGWCRSLGFISQSGSFMQAMRHNAWPGRWFLQLPPWLLSLLEHS